MTDALLSSLATAHDGAAGLVAAVGDEHWDRPTPCSDWTVRELVNHLVGGNRLTARAVRGEQLPPGRLGRRGHVDQLGDDPAGAYRSSADDVLAALSAAGALDRTYTLPAGTFPGPGIVHLRAVETLVHGWDLARATGQEPPFGDDLCEPALAFSRDVLGRMPEERRPFAESRPVADDAPAIDRLAALLGRTPG